MRRTAPFLLLTAALLQCTSPLKKYEAAARVFEPEIRAFEHLDSTETYPPDALLFTGSSSIRLWATLRQDMAPYPVIQRGFGGATFADLACYTPRIVHPHRCRAVVVFVANDITGLPADRPPDEVAGLFAYIHRTIREKLPDQPIYCIEITPTPSRWAAWPRIREANAQIRQFCEGSANTHFIATSGRFIGPDGTPRAALFGPDQLHLNADGYRLWTALIRAKLDATLK